MTARINSEKLANNITACYVFPGLKFNLNIRKLTGSRGIELIEQEVCEYYGTTPEILHTKSRLRERVVARQLTMYLTKLFTNMTLKKIGTYYGRDHTTCIHAIATIKDLLETDEVIQNDVKLITEILNTYQ